MTSGPIPSPGRTASLYVRLIDRRGGVYAVISAGEQGQSRPWLAFEHFPFNFSLKQLIRRVIPFFRDDCFWNCLPFALSIHCLYKYHENELFFLWLSRRLMPVAGGFYCTEPAGGDFEGH